MQRIIILGSGGTSIDILDTLGELNCAAGRAEYQCAGFLDDNESLWGNAVCGAPVLGPLIAARNYPLLKPVLPRGDVAYPN